MYFIMHTPTLFVFILCNSAFSEKKNVMQSVTDWKDMR